MAQVTWADRKGQDGIKGRGRSQLKEDTLSHMEYAYTVWVLLVLAEAGSTWKGLDLPPKYNNNNR